MRTNLAITVIMLFIGILITGCGLTMQISLDNSSQNASADADRTITQSRPKELGPVASPTAAVAGPGSQADAVQLWPVQTPGVSQAAPAKTLANEAQSPTGQTPTVPAAITPTIPPRRE